MEMKNWGMIYDKVATEAEAAKEKSQKGLLLSQREAAVIREKALYDRMERGGVIVATKDRVQSIPAENTQPMISDQENEHVVADVVVLDGENVNESDDVMINQIKNIHDEENVVIQTDTEKNASTLLDVDDNKKEDDLSDVQDVGSEKQQSNLVINEGPVQDDAMQNVEQHTENEDAHTLASNEEGDLDDEKKEEENAATRAASWHTIYKLENAPGMTYEDLNAATKNEGDKKFIDLTRQLWTEFTVHQEMKIGDAKNKSFVDLSDIDGESCLEILRLAGIVIDREKVYFAPKGETHNSGVVMDTSKKHGVLSEFQGKVLIFDHHDEKLSKRGSSSVKFVYETLVKMGMLEQQEYLDRFVEFVTRMDNLDFPEAEMDVIYGNYHKTLYGLGHKMNVQKLVSYFESGVDPAVPLSDQQLRDEIYYNPATKKEERLFKLSEYMKEMKERGERDIDGLQDDGLIVDTTNDRFGKVLIAPGKISENGKLTESVAGANGSDQLALFTRKDKQGKYVYGAYFKWMPERNSFAMFTKNPMNTESLPQGLGEGFNVREHMWLRPSTEVPLTIDLRGILSALYGHDRDVSTSLQTALKNNAATKTIMQEVGNVIFTKEFLEKVVLDNAASSIRDICTMLSHQQEGLRQIYDEKVQSVKRGMKNRKQKEDFDQAFKKQKGGFTNVQKENQKIWQEIYIESICAYNIKCICDGHIKKITKNIDQGRLTADVINGIIAQKDLVSLKSVTDEFFKQKGVGVQLQYEKQFKERTKSITSEDLHQQKMIDDVCSDILLEYQRVFGGKKKK